MAKRERWDSRFAFVMASIGSAVGLGNIWRFPYICYQNGGGAFLIPYFIALFTVGIPLLIVEFGIGHWFGGAAPHVFKNINKKWEWAGWWAIVSAFIISVYYSVIMAWCLCYFFHSVGLVWGQNASQFFSQFLGKTSSPFALGGLRPQILFALLFIWTSIYMILYKGVKSIGKVVAITVPLPTVLLLILAIRGITLPGALDGLGFYLTPNFSKLASPSVWLAAYAQIFFSLSLAQGIMIVYASYLKKKSDITNNAFITALADGGTAFLAGFAVFSVLGYLSYSTGVSINDVAGSGMGLAFITYPTAISHLPVAASLFGAIFFIALLTFGIDSAFSMIESVTGGIEEKWGISKEKATLIICLLGFLMGIPFATGGGSYWIDVTDHFISNFGLVFVGLMECIVFGYIMGAENLREHVNEISDIKLGRWWDYLIKFVSPFILLFIALASLIELIGKGYEHLPSTALAVGGFIVVISLLISIALMKVK
ncbi:MAG: sodium-dependent transporter [Candidatus Thermoplasmatota archaeon]|nr:sodium-dependent transporter [Candidatus Thermoplasmatota archaeon]